MFDFIQLYKKNVAMTMRPSDVQHNSYVQQRAADYTFRQHNSMDPEVDEYPYLFLDLVYYLTGRKVFLKD